MTSLFARLLSAMGLLVLPAAPAVLSAPVAAAVEVVAVPDDAAVVLGTSLKVDVLANDTVAGSVTSLTVDGIDERLTVTVADDFTLTVDADDVDDFWTFFSYEVCAGEVCDRSEVYVDARVPDVPPTLSAYPVRTVAGTGMISQVRLSGVWSDSRHNPVFTVIDPPSLGEVTVAPESWWARGSRIDGVRYQYRAGVAGDTDTFTLQVCTDLGCATAPVTVTLQPYLDVYYPAQGRVDRYVDGVLVDNPGRSWVGAPILAGPVPGDTVTGAPVVVAAAGPVQVERDVTDLLGSPFRYGDAVFADDGSFTYTFTGIPADEISTFMRSARDTAVVYLTDGGVTRSFTVEVLLVFGLTLTTHDDPYNYVPLTDPTGVTGGFRNWPYRDLRLWGDHPEIVDGFWFGGTTDERLRGYVYDDSGTYPDTSDDVYLAELRLEVSEPGSGTLELSTDCNPAYAWMVDSTITESCGGYAGLRYLPAGEFASDGSFTATATPGTTDTFTYRLCWQLGSLPEECSNTSTVTLNLAGPPSAADDDASQDEVGQTVPVDVIGNDSFTDAPFWAGVDPSTAEIAIVEAPTRGSVWVDEDRAAVYTPSPGEQDGVDSFTYQLCDFGGCDEAMVTVRLASSTPPDTTTTIPPDTTTPDTTTPDTTTTTTPAGTTPDTTTTTIPAGTTSTTTTTPPAVPAPLPDTGSGATVRLLLFGVLSAAAGGVLLALARRR